PEAKLDFRLGGLDLACYNQTKPVLPKTVTYLLCVVMSAFSRLRLFLFTVASVVLIAAGPVAHVQAGTILLPRESSWKYHNLNSNLFTLQPTWNQPGYDDSVANGWAGPSPAPIGYNFQNNTQYCKTAIEIGTPIRYPVIFY